MSIKTFGAALLGATALFLSNTSSALAVNLVQRSFTVSNLTGSLAGNSYSGSFVYDDDLLIANGSALISDFSFSFPGFTGFDPRGLPSIPRVVNSPVFDLSISYAPPPEGSSAFAFGALGSNTFVYGSTLGVSSSFNVDGRGSVTYGAPVAIPTPALLPGLVGMGIAAVRKKSRSEQSEEVAETVEV